MLEQTHHAQNSIYEGKYSPHPKKACEQHEVYVTWREHDGAKTEKSRRNPYKRYR
jgi:hypothetical protein